MLFVYISLCDSFLDPRAKEFAYRILFQEDASNLPKEVIVSNQLLMKERWTSEGPWPCAETYLNEAKKLKQERTSKADQQIIEAVESYLITQQKVIQHG